MTEQAEDGEETMLARATVNLRGLRVGQVVPVDPSNPYIAECLAADYLVPAVAE